MISGIGEESNFTGTCFFDSRNAANQDVPVSNDLSSDLARQFEQCPGDRMLVHFGSANLFTRSKTRWAAGHLPFARLL
jgi:hypothetical protein